MTEFMLQTALPVYQQIAKHIEDRIISMDLREGERLPSTARLAKKYGVTPVTVQKSLQRLVELDLIDRSPKRGTFVKSHSISNTVGLIFGYNPSTEESPLYLRMLEHYNTYARQHNLNVKVYLDISSDRALYDVRSDVTSGKIKSLVVLDSSDPLTDWLMEQKTIPWISPVTLDFHKSAKIGVEYLLEKGYREITMVSMLPEEVPYADWQEDLRNERRGAEEAIKSCSDAELEFVQWGNSEIAGYQKGKEFLSSKKLPDAIFVHHDIVCRGFLLALAEQGIKVPDDIALLTHANIGCDFASPVKLSKVVFDPVAMVESSLSQLMSTEAKPGQLVDMNPISPKIIPGISCGE